MLRRHGMLNHKLEELNGKDHHHYTALSPSLVWNILVDCCSKKFHDDGLILSLPPSLPKRHVPVSLDLGGSGRLKHKTEIYGQKTLCISGHSF
jgi:hypothetical protein